MVHKKLTVRLVLAGLIALQASCGKNYTSQQLNHDQSHNISVPAEEINARTIGSNKSTKRGGLKVCTLIACFDAIVVKLPENLLSLPDEYQMEIFLDGRLVSKPKVTVSSTDALQCRQDHIEQRAEFGRDSVFIHLLNEECKSEKNSGFNRTQKISYFSIMNTKARGALGLKIQGSDEKILLIKEVDLSLFKEEVEEPNGPGCGSCRKIEVDFR
jgi:hypothetical protein